MESYVLLPHGLALLPLPASDCSSPSVARLLEQRVGVTVRVAMARGDTIEADRGTVRWGKLEVYSTLSKDDPRFLNGGFDEVIECSPGRRVRHCNWIRFLSSDDPTTRTKRARKSPNVVCRRRRRRPNGGPPVFYYEASEDIPAGSELVASFEAVDGGNCCDAEAFSRSVSEVIMASPLDLSTPLSVLPGEMTTATSPAKKYNCEARVVAPDCSVDSGVSSSGEECEVKKNLTVVTACPVAIAIPTPTSPLERPSSSESAEDLVNNNNDGEKIQSSFKKLDSPAKASGQRKKKMLPCDFCGKCFDRPSLLNRHVRTHTGERPHVCDVCEKGFSTSSSLNTHRRIHSGEKPHQCGICGKRFTASSNLYYHRMTHVKEKPHKCELCQKSFPTPGDLKSHMYIHNGSWPHRCPICERGFSKVTNLKNHLFLHTGQKPFECIKCGKRFALECNMKAHMKTHRNSATGDNNRNKDLKEEDAPILLTQAQA